MINTEFKKLSNIKNLARITMALLTIVHMIYMIVFYFVDIEKVFILKGIEFCISLVFTLLLFRLKQFFNIAIYFAHFSIMVSCFFCTYFLGQGYGFILVMVTILSLGYVHDFNNPKYPIIIGIIEVFFISFVVFFTSNIPDYDSPYKAYFLCWNIFNVFIIVFFYSIITIGHSNEENKILDLENKKLQNKVNRDYLTNLLNRRSMNEILEQYLDFFKQDKIRSMTLIIGDIDGFKEINDNYGHNFGDIVLKNTAKIIKNGTGHLRNTYVARWGGEEFLILTSGVSVSNIESTMNEIRKKVENYTHQDGYNSKKITITFGVCHSLRVESLDKMLSIADSKLYEGKKNGKNQVCLQELEII